MRSRSRNRRSRIWKRIPGAEKVVSVMTKGDTKSSNRDYRRDSASDMEGNPLNTETPLAPTADRTIYLNQSPPPGDVAVKFKSNQISTAKYTVITFLPKFLYEQFRRVANCFFLLIGLLQQIPGISPTGRWVTLIPFLMIEFVTALKEIFEDLLRHRQDDKTNNAPAFVYCKEKRTFEKKGWKEVCVGDFVKVQDGAYFPADLVILSSTKEQGMCYIETASLDGETNLKVRSAISQTSGLTDEKDLANFVGKIKCEEPNRHIYTFNGNIEIQSENNQTFPLSPSVILLRGAKLMNTGHIFGVVVYTGHDSKLLMNYKKAPSKRSNMDKITNNHIYFLFATLITIALASTGFSEAQKYDGEKLTYIDTAGTSVPNFFMNFLTFFILYNNLIPISLQVTLDFVKFLQAYFVNWDEEMYYAPTDTYALARTSNLNEDLGQIKYIFSDKTGTLTQNIMEYIKATIAGTVYSINQDSNDEYDSQLLTDLRNRRDAQSNDVRDFLLCMAVCHTVIPEFDEKTGHLKSYNASSPDERALVEGAARYGFRFVDKGPHSTFIEVPGNEAREEYEVLNVIEFTSARKRMSVIVKCPDGTIKLFIKGADNMILERIGFNSEQRVYYDSTLKCLDEFAGEGLRTLCLAMKVIPPAEYTTWAAKYHAASIAITNREEQLDEVATIMEQDLTLLGATAIEDKLQDGVPETIHRCLEANIKVWVLTGDKQETAINIGHSSRLLDHDSDIILINTDNLEDTKNEVRQQLSKFNALPNKVEAQNKSLVVDGPSLTFALDEGLKNEFLDLLKRCRSVICCRVSPMQKAEVVGLVKQSSKSDLTLAIGDGANDVAMIQKAHIGVGISGNEGLQAANSSDFAIAQFRFLQRLLFVHGAWFYARNAKVIVYSFYKNICLYIIELWFAIYSYWTGQVLFERWSIGRSFFTHSVLATSFFVVLVALNSHTRLSKLI